MEPHFITDVAKAGWLTSANVPWDRLITFGPDRFSSYARLRFIPDPVTPDQEAADAELPLDHPSDIAQARLALRLLEQHTTTPSDCFFCVWDGYSDIPIPSAVTLGPLVELPHRRYALMQGPLVKVIDNWEALLGRGVPIAPPAFVWPDDHAWVFASDVDPHWAGIGGTREAIADLVASPDLDVVRTEPAAIHPAYY